MRRRFLQSLAGLLLAGVAGQAASAEVRAWDRALPELGLHDAAGGRFDPASLRGKVVVMNFWAAWCAPCREEIPHLQAYAATQRKSEVEVVLVNVGDSPRVMQSTLGKLGSTLLSLSDAEGQALGRSLGLAQLPATLILDRAGRVRWLVRGKIDASAEPVRARVAQLLERS